MKAIVTLIADLLPIALCATPAVYYEGFSGQAVSGRCTGSLLGHVVQDGSGTLHTFTLLSKPLTDI